MHLFVLRPVVAMCLLLLVPVAARSQDLRLSTRDYVEIRQLTARYAQALDNGDAIAGLFVDDGESIRPNARGRAALAVAVRHAAQGPAHVAHFTFNHVIEPQESGVASGWQYVAEFRFDDPAPPGARGTGRGGQPVDQRSLVGRRGGTLVSLGRYRDTYVKAREGWRFRRREYTPLSGTDDRAARPAPPATGVERWEARPLDEEPPASPLAPTDYLDIEQLVASYGHALDSGFGTSDNGPAYANLFTPDGVFYSRGRPMRGPDALAAIARAQPNGPDYARHFLANAMIESSGAVVIGRQYLAVIDIGEDGGPTTVYLGGYYEDIYRKTDAGWRFEERRSFGARTGP